MGRGNKKGRRGRGNKKEVDPNAPKVKSQGQIEYEGRRGSRSQDKLRKHNAMMEEFYGVDSPNALVTDQVEWNAVFDAMRSELPASFRINTVGAFGKRLKETLAGELSAPYPIDCLGKNGDRVNVVDPPKPIPWYPGDNAWQLSATRGDIRRTQVLKPTHQFLMREGATGRINRQEQVSMIPPFFLQVESHHMVLDMCASPGSKTLQLIESIHNGVDSKSLIPKGIVVANDVNPKRAYMLVNQCKRVASCSLLVTAHAAQSFPNMRRMLEWERNSRNKNSTTTPLPPAMAEIVDSSPEGVFDRILCDVPCSGDGTLRKAPDMWRSWNPGMGMGLHNVQVAITMRGVQLLKVGGLMVYSTCSLNPLENEAVVAEVMRQSDGCMEVMDCSAMFPELKRRPGWSKWAVGLTKKDMDCRKEQSTALNQLSHESAKSKQAGIETTTAASEDVTKTAEETTAAKEDVTKTTGENEDSFAEETKKVADEFRTNDRFAFFKSMEEFEDRADGGKSLRAHAKVSASMFAPEGVDKMGLEHCMRLLPHDQNTGGFFVTVLRKLCPLNSKVRAAVAAKGTDDVADEDDKEDDVTDTPTTDEPAANAGDKRKRPEKKKPDAYLGFLNDPFITIKSELWDHLKDYYGLTDDFAGMQYLKTRSVADKTAKQVTLISPSLNDLGFSLGLNVDKLKIINAGVPVFRRNESSHCSCKYRLYQDGLKYVLPYLTKRIVKLSMHDVALLVRDCVEPNLSTGRKDGTFFTAMSTESQAQLAACGSGCTVVTLIDEDAIKYTEALGEPFAAVTWHGTSSVHCLVSQDELAVMYVQLCESGMSCGVDKEYEELKVAKAVKDEEAAKDAATAVASAGGDAEMEVVVEEAK